MIVVQILVGLIVWFACGALAAWMLHVCIPSGLPADDEAAALTGAVVCGAVSVACVAVTLATMVLHSAIVKVIGEYDA